MKISGVIFDFNGTLFWDTELHNKAWDVFLAEKGFSLTDAEKNKTIHGKNNKDILTSIFPFPLTPEMIASHGAEKEKIYQDLCLETDMQLAPGAADLLTFLQHEHVPFTIATASEIGNVEFYFEKMGLDLFFDRHKVVYNDGAMPGKPNPRIFEKAITVLGIKASETLIFEDSISGIEAAENAGAGKIIIVDSNHADHRRWHHQKIRSFDEVDRNLFKNQRIAGT